MNNRTEIEKKIDILEEDILSLDPILLQLLLKDKTTRKNIMWCTKDYENYGSEFNEYAQIQVESITGKYSNIIQPRAAKPKEIQEQRAKKRGEVFTPSWVCNEQNNYIDEAWFGRPNVFNIPNSTSWTPTTEKIIFEKSTRNWKAYIATKRLEISCGEAPYLVSRYDTTTGEFIPVSNRIGLFDRKMRIVKENCEDDKTWLKYSIKAIKSVFGYDFQGDSVLIARENLLYSYIDYYLDHFKQKPDVNLLKQIANIITWNIWQMDGLKCVVPYSCNKDWNLQNKKPQQLEFVFPEQTNKINTTCLGCAQNNIYSHIGIYCRIYDWTNTVRSIRFIDTFKEHFRDGKI